MGEKYIRESQQHKKQKIKKMYYVEAPYYIYHAECNTEKFVIFPTAESVVELKKTSMIFFKKLYSEDLLPLLSFAIFIHHTPTLLCCLIFLSYIFEPQNYHKTNDEHKIKHI